MSSTFHVGKTEKMCGHMCLVDLCKKSAAESFISEKIPNTSALGAPSPIYANSSRVRSMANDLKMCLEIAFAAGALAYFDTTG